MWVICSKLIQTSGCSTSSMSFVCFVKYCYIFFLQCLQRSYQTKAYVYLKVVVFLLTNKRIFMLSKVATILRTSWVSQCNTYKIPQISPPVHTAVNTFSGVVFMRRSMKPILAATFRCIFFPFSSNVTQTHAHDSGKSQVAKDTSVLPYLSRQDDTVCHTLFSFFLCIGCLWN